MILPTRYYKEWECIPSFPPIDISKKHFGPDIFVRKNKKLSMNGIESTFPKPPDYYKQFGIINSSN